MTQLILNIKDESVLPGLKKAVRSFKGVSVARPKKCGLDEALEDIEAGRVHGPFNTVEELFASLDD